MTDVADLVEAVHATSLLPQRKRGSTMSVVAPNAFKPILLAAALIGLALMSPADYRSRHDMPQIGARVDNSSGQLDANTFQNLSEIADTYARVAKENYALIVDTLHTEDRPVRVSFVTIVVTPAYDGSAATYNSGNGRIIKVGAKYALEHRDDVGVIVHEMVHVVQSYRTKDPEWLSEGIADYVRWFFYEPEKKRPHSKLPKANARGSYQTTAAFLFWAATKYDRFLVPKLNLALQNGAYTEDLFRQVTGKSLDELNAEWQSALSPSPPKADENQVTPPVPPPTPPRV